MNKENFRHHKNVIVSPLGPGVVIFMRQQTKTLVEEVDYRLFDSNPLAEPKITFPQLDPHAGTNFTEFFFYQNADIFVGENSASVC